MSGANALTRIGVLAFDGFGSGVVHTDVGHQLAMEVLGRSKDTAVDDVTLDFANPKLDLVEPGRVGRGEVKLDSPLSMSSFMVARPSPTENASRPFLAAPASSPNAMVTFSGSWNGSSAGSLTMYGRRGMVSMSGLLHLV